MKRGKILQACMNLRGTRAWETLGKYDATHGRDQDTKMLGLASSPQKKAYEKAYVDHSK